MFYSVIVRDRKEVSGMIGEKNFVQVSPAIAAIRLLWMESLPRWANRCSLLDTLS